MIEDLGRLYLDHVWQFLRQWKSLPETGGYAIFTEGNGNTLTDIHGKGYLDYWFLIMFNYVGSGGKEFAEATHKQMVKLHLGPAHEPAVPKED